MDILCGEAWYLATFSAAFPFLSPPRDINAMLVSHASPAWTGKLGRDWNSLSQSHTVCIKIHFVNSYTR